jgi:hypothetical protein
MDDALTYDPLAGLMTVPDAAKALRLSENSDLPHDHRRAARSAKTRRQVLDRGRRDQRLPRPATRRSRQTPRSSRESKAIRISTASSALVVEQIAHFLHPRRGRTDRE